MLALCGADPFGPAPSMLVAVTLPVAAARRPPAMPMSLEGRLMPPWRWMGEEERAGEPAGWWAEYSEQVDPGGDFAPLSKGL